MPNKDNNKIGDEKMKKIICAVISITLLLCLSSCGGTGSGGVANPSGGYTSAIVQDVSQNVPFTANDLYSLSNEKKCWGQGYNVNDKNQPTGSIDYNNKYGKYGGVFMGEKENTMYLTFDEGYENGYTAAILDTLKEKQVSAVFFVTYDYVKRNDELVRRMINEGHIVGNHSWSHPSMPDLSVEECRDEVQKLHDYVKENYNYEMVYIRPPRGEFSERTLAVSQSLGYKSIFWSFAYKDYDVNNQPDADKAFTRITEAAHSGAIYLLHAVSKTNTDILGRVIDKWRSDGYTIAKFDI